MLLVPAMIDTNKAAMPVRRSIDELSAGPCVGDKPASRKRLTSDVPFRARQCQRGGCKDAEALHGRRHVCTRHGDRFVLGGVAMGFSGVEVLITETGQPGREWIANVDAAGWLFFAGPC